MSRITLIGRGEPIQFNCKDGESLLEAMRGHDIYLSADCAGRGTCGKCKLQLLEGKLEITFSDRDKLTELELEQGFRLACKAYPRGACSIRLASGREDDFEVIAEYYQSSNDHETINEDYAIAIDIGTTTIAISLLGLTRKGILLTDTFVNKQRIYGADVISRMKASNDGNKELLKGSIQRDLREGIQRITERSGIEKSRLQKISIAGNTTMGHLLLGYSCQGLSSYPFTPVNINTIVLPYEEVMGSDDLSIPVTLLPGISAFVGGDIAAGLLACDFDQSEKPCLLIDLGTNGEMAIGNKERILVCSAAAGPAFEGGNISCGVGSISGAISDIVMKADKIELQTIGQKPPIGLCGTGVVALVSELFRTKLVDETGLFCDKYFNEGYPVAVNSEGDTILFTQKDLREFQLAKAAIRAGVEILILRYGITYTEIDTVYLAGGFGYKMDLEKALQVGLLPKELSGKMKAIGNSALKGAVKSLVEAEAQESLERILQVSSEINLSNEKDFNELYLKHMFLGDGALE